MSYLNNYLKIIPKADADIIRRNIAENKELFEIKNLSESEYKRLIDELINSNEISTKVEELATTITADELNNFYSNVALDLHKIFPEQNNIEKLGKNYERIYQGHLEELSNEIEKIRYSVNRLSSKESTEENTNIKGYSFEPDTKSKNSEIYTEETAYLYIDRNNRQVRPAKQEKLFHTYHLVLNKTEEIDLLINENGITTANLEITYESPHVLHTTNPEYAINKVIDGDPSTFWFNVAQKPNNSVDFINIMPGRTKEGSSYVQSNAE